LSALEKALNHSKNIGIDECEIVVVKKKIITVRITDSEIAEIKQNLDESFGIRLIHQNKIASIQTTNFLPFYGLRLCNEVGHACPA